MKKIRIVVPAVVLLAGLALGSFALFARHKQAVAQANPSPNTPVQSQSAQSSSNSTRPVLASNNTSTSYRDGTYAGSRENAFYGFVRVKAIVKSGQLTDVQVIEYPNDNGTSRYINSIALPYLVKEAVQVQDPRQMYLVSGATLSSEAFVQSLNTALLKAE